MDVADWSAPQYNQGTPVSSTECRAACEANTSCSAYDVDVVGDQCWLSVLSGTLTEDMGNQHYDLIDECTQDVD